MHTFISHRFDTETLILQKYQYLSTLSLSRVSDHPELNIGTEKQ